MKKRIKYFCFIWFTLVSPVTLTFGQIVEKNVKHVKVFYEPGMYGGWPANYGIWSWGDEILVGFEKAFYENRGPKSHNMDQTKPRSAVFARSMDGGETWTLEDPGMSGGLNYPDCSLAINFEHPDFALTARRSKWKSGIFYSYDRGKNWEGPCPLPDFKTPGLAARTDYIINSDKECLLFLTAAKSNGNEGRALAAKTLDGGVTWSFLSWIGHEHSGYSIMPSTVRISSHELLTTIRKKESGRSLIEAYYSDDNGMTWRQLNNPVDDTGIGNPSAMVKLDDGRICLAYGYRAEEADIKSGLKTSDIRAKLSSDNGKTWSKDYILRNDGSGRDLGYPRMIQRPDGKIVVVYYFMDKATGPERYIAATIWEPPAIRNE